MWQFCLQFFFWSSVRSARTGKVDSYRELANTRHWTNVVSMLARRLRRRANSDTTLVRVCWGRGVNEYTWGVGEHSVQSQLFGADQSAPLLLMVELKPTYSSLTKPSVSGLAPAPAGPSGNLLKRVNLIPLATAQTECQDACQSVCTVH